MSTYVSYYDQQSRGNGKKKKIVGQKKNEKGKKKGRDMGTYMYV